MGDQEGERTIRVIGRFDRSPRGRTPVIVQDGTGLGLHADPERKRIQGVGSKGPTEETIALIEPLIPRLLVELRNQSDRSPSAFYDLNHS